MERQDGKIIERNIETEMKTAYIDYAMSVIVSRALPDARDGLKPVHRRILYSMHEDGITSDKPYRKCANTVGSVEKKIADLEEKIAKIIESATPSIPNELSLVPSKNIL